MKKLYFIFLVPLFLYSQNLKDLIDLSIKNNLIQASKQGIEAMEYSYKSTKSGYLPKLDFGAKYSITDPELANMPQKSANLYGSINYVLYDGGKKEEIFNSFENAIKSKENSLEALKNDLSLKVIKNYFDYDSLQNNKEAKTKEIEQLEAQKERLNRFYEAGTITEDEVQKIISRLQNSMLELQEIDLNLLTILHNLEALIGFEVKITKGSKIAEFFKEKENQRFDISSLEYDTKRKLDLAKAQESGYLPTISLNNTFNYYDRDFKSEKNKISSLHHQNITSANLNWNIFSFGETKYNKEAKYKEYLASKANFEYEKNKAKLDLELARKAYEIAKVKIKVSEATLKASQSAYEVIKSKFENGLVDNVAFLQSLSETYQARSQHKQALNDLEIKKALIIYHSGEKLQEYIK